MGRSVRYRKKWGNGSYSLVMGKGVGFDSTEYNLQPISWKSKLAFVPERLGVTADFQQKDHLAINAPQVSVANGTKRRN